MSEIPQLDVKIESPEYGLSNINKYMGTFDIETHYNNLSKVYKMHIDTKEALIREGLIALGWTPPESDK